MRKRTNAPATLVRNRVPRAARRVNYSEFVGGWAAEMAESLPDNGPADFRAPFRLVLVDPQGSVVFEGEVDENWSVKQEGPSKIVRRCHFPAIALLTNRSLVTRTFQIERSL